MSVDVVDECSVYLGPVTRRFQDGIQPILPLSTQGFHVVTGFGPTNAPTAGTLSVMLGIIELQKVLDAPFTVVISDLGAWNCRNVDWETLCHFRDAMARFLVELGFDRSKGIIRTHIDTDNLVRAGRIARFLNFGDVDSDQEEFLELYGAEGILGSRTGLLVDTLYTIADVLQPLDEGKPASLVVSGIEEGYFTRLAIKVLDRQKTERPTLDWDGKIGALFFRVLRGLNGYPKMSKSIPSSSINVGLPESELRHRILSDDPGNQDAIWDSIEFASRWNHEQIDEARQIYSSSLKYPDDWKRVRLRYFEDFVDISSIWGRISAV